MSSSTTVVRKRDGARYVTDLKPVKWPWHEHLGDCYLLRPAFWGGRAHYKTIAAFNREYVKEEDA
ncbi:hypothetical protein [Azotobacter vinelandii]|uniref:hypothetical protein n=1 Tax=Azotobacter vinelandii TaxID=354 RepID=UPI002665AE97|nr:hypothetical protein [Azotobacter vinelandii]WKN20866.1 hypothetical protein AVAEIV_003892 [Azotobacter vinelandii]